MSVPIIETPKEIKLSLKAYKPYFHNKKQYKHFERLITGLIVSENKTIEEINDCFGKCNQSNLNRFVNGSWDIDKINRIRLNQLKQSINLKSGIFICDPTMLHKTGKHMEKANYHYSGKTKKIEWGHLLVNSLFYTDEINFPVRGDIYIREEDSDEKYPFSTTREIFLSQLDYAIDCGLPIKYAMVDAGLYADFVLNHIKSKELYYIAGVRVSQKVSMNRQKRISIGEIEKLLKISDFNCFEINYKKYYLYTQDIYTRGIGKEKLIISFKEGDEDTKKIYTTNIFHLSDESLMHLLLKRWKVEELHRNEKQHLGLEDYQVRKFGAIQRVVCAVLVAYTLLVLSASCRGILQTFNRGLETIGEGCRYFRLIATKGWRWMKRQISKGKEKLREVLNRFVFVKNAKV